MCPTAITLVDKRFNKVVDTLTSFNSLQHYIFVFSRTLFMLVDRSLNLTGAEIEKFRFRFCDWIAKISTNLQKHI